MPTITRFFGTVIREPVIKQFTALNDRFQDNRYATSVLGVASLPAQLLVMLGATAVD